MEIQFKYYSGFIENNILDDFEEKLSNHSIKLSKNNISGTLQMSAFDIISHFCLFLPPDLTNSLLSSVIYDLLKAPLIQIWRSLSGEKIQITTSNGRIEEKDISLGIQFKAEHNNYELKIPLSLSEELKETCINEMFAFIKGQSAKNSNNFDPMLMENYIVIYNEKDQKWEKIELVEIIKNLKNN